MLHDGVWHIHCLASDAKTPISPYRTVGDEATLIRLLGYVGATDAEIEEVHADIRRWGRGTVRIRLKPGRKNLLRIRRPWRDEASLSDQTPQ